jgi:hypothetical protein
VPGGENLVWLHPAQQVGHGGDVDLADAKLPVAALFVERQVEEPGAGGGDAAGLERSARLAATEHALELADFRGVAVVGGLGRELLAHGLGKLGAGAGAGEVEHEIDRHDGLLVGHGRGCPR